MIVGVVVDRRSSVDGLEYAVGDRVLVRRDSGLAPAEALITADNPRRPHLVKVRYLRPRAGGAWIARTRVIRPAAEDCR